MIPRKLENRFALLGVALTGVVGGVIGLVGYQQMTEAVRREAIARVAEATRVGRRHLEAEIDRLDPSRRLPLDAKLTVIPVADVHPGMPLHSLFQQALTGVKAEGFALLEEGLCAVSVRRDPDAEKLLVAILPLRDANRLPDQIRTVVFGKAKQEPNPTTVTIFEKNIRIATNVRLPDGRRAIGTKVSEEVARKVLGEGKSWNDRAFVVDRWVISSYLPIHDIEGNVVGMLYAGLDESLYGAQKGKSILLFLAFILGLTLVVSAGGWYLGKRLAHPLAKLTQASASLGRGDREHIQVSPTDPEEVMLLAETFNHMADEVSAKTLDLEASNRQAKEALNDYMEVLGFVAHELKSPVSGALTQLRTIEGGYAGEVPETLRRPLAAIGRYLDYGHEIALSFNHLSQAESAGFAPLKKQLADFCEEVISPVIADFSPQASQQEMTISLHGEGIPLRADPGLMRVVMDNLIGNAVKYGRTGTDIQVTVHRLPERVRVEVRNQGVGVPRKRFPELFAKFHRIYDSELSSRKGTGVGLYLVKKFIDLHGGQVGVEGQYKEWIEFWFEIPDNEGDPQE